MGRRGGDRLLHGGRSHRRIGRRQAGPLRRRRPRDRDLDRAGPPGRSRLPRRQRDRPGRGCGPDHARRGQARRGGRHPGAPRRGRREGRRLRRDRFARLRLGAKRRDLPRRQPHPDRGQGPAGDRRTPARGSRRRRGRLGRRLRARPGAGEPAGRGGPADGRAARLPPPLPSFAALLPQLRRGSAPAADRRARDRRHLPGAQHRRRARLDLDLRAEPDHGPGPGPGDRLQPVRGVEIPGGDRQVRPRPAGDEGHDGDLGAHRPVQLADGDRGARVTAGLPAALPVLDGPGRLDRRDPCGA